MTLQPAAGGVTLELDSVTKSFDGVLALKGIALTVDPGERVCIFGRSGCGKSTLLRVAIGLEVPTSGDVRVAGRSLFFEGSPSQQRPARASHMRRTRAPLGMVFQSFNLFPHMTAAQNVIEGLRFARGITKDKAETVSKEYLHRVGLANKASSYPGQMSGGEQQRVAIARALALEPSILLFDEPTSALDPELIGEVLAVIQSLADESKMSMVIVTHEIPFARRIADRGVFMDSGSIIEDGAIEEVLGNPRNDRTREFLRSVIDK